ncbi:MAG: RNA pseudouridine synthase [Saprospiraceae bacterium]|nr:RNA pseudouridine synthase [Saprospiraceae bacterium]
MHKIKKGFSILFENNDFLIVDKPSGLLSIPDRFDIEKENLSTLLSSQFGEIFTVHRLDKETSGVICFAKNKDSHKTLNEMFENRDIDKRYYAICEKSPPEEIGIIDAPIAHSHSQSGKMCIHSRGKESITKFKLLKQWKNFCLIECKLETGRTHQIRVHLAYIDCPIACDSLYGNIQIITIQDLKRKSKLSKSEEEFKPLMNRTALHAHSIGFSWKKEQILVTSELPKDMRALVNQLDKWNTL